MPKKDVNEAAMKRSIARRFNDSLIGRSSRSASDRTLDRRTAKKLDRYRQELKNNKKSGSKDLTALDIAIRVNELLKHGDRLTDIKKLSKPRAIEYNEDTLVGVLREMQPIYQFRVEAYRHAGVKKETLVAAGVLGSMPAKRGPAPGSRPSARRGSRDKGGKKHGK